MSIDSDPEKVHIQAFFEDELRGTKKRVYNVVEYEENRQKNWPLLYKVLDHVKEHPEEHDQQYWFTKIETSTCGTAACFAGWALLFAHPEAKPEWVQDDAHRTYLLEDEKGECWDVATLAAHELGLDKYEANHLFDALNDVQDIERLITEWDKEANHVES